MHTHTHTHTHTCYGSGELFDPAAHHNSTRMCMVSMCHAYRGSTLMVGGEDDKMTHHYVMHLCHARTEDSHVRVNTTARPLTACRKDDQYLSVSSFLFVSLSHSCTHKWGFEQR